jgi:hypothetical protein
MISVHPNNTRCLRINYILSFHCCRWQELPIYTGTAAVDRFGCPSHEIWIFFLGNWQWGELGIGEFGSERVRVYHIKPSCA